MSKTIKLTLPFPPTLNKMYPSGADGRRYTSQKGKTFRADAQLIARLEKAPMFTGDLVVNLELYRPRKQGDIDNFSKSIFDALKGICFVDDKQIVALHIFKLDDKDYPRAEVEIIEL